MFKSIEDLPNRVVKSISDPRCLEFVRKMVNHNLAAGHDTSRSFMEAWAALERIGHEFEKGRWVRKAHGAVPTYGSKPVINAEDIIAWAASQGFSQTLAPDDLHVTVVFSRSPYLSTEYFQKDYDYPARSPYENLVLRGGKRWVSALGNSGAVVLKMDAPDLVQEWVDHRRMGASYDFESYIPHITITYAGAPENLSEVQPYSGDIVLGATRFEHMSDDFSPTLQEVLKMVNEREYLHGGTAHGRLLKANQEAAPDTLRKKAMSDDFHVEVNVKKATNDEQRIVWGWASVSTVKGQPYFDHHGDHWSAEDMALAVNDFMKDTRVLKAMHSGEQIGTVVHSFPLTAEVAKAFGIECDIEGWIVGTYVENDEIWKKAKQGQFPGFSIGGRGKRYAA